MLDESIEQSTQARIQMSRGFCLGEQWTDQSTNVKIGIQKELLMDKATTMFKFLYNTMEQLTRMRR